MHNNPVWAIYKVAALYIGAVIGAGFASGQEILQFFIVFGKSGFRGVVLATLLFACLGGLVMLLAISIKSTNYTDIYSVILGKNPGRAMDILSLVMLPGGLVVMLAGGSAVFSEHLGLPGWLGTLLIALATVGVMSRGLPGVVSANAVLVPLKLTVILLICSCSLIYSGAAPDRHIIGAAAAGGRINWLFSALLYVSYNMVVPVAVLSSLGGKVTYREGVTGGIAGGLALGLATGLVYFAGLSFYPGITGYEVPLLYIAGRLGAAVKLMLGPLIWVAILTTAIADTHGFASRFAGTQTRRYKIIGAATVILALPVSNLKFSFLVRVLYPLFGYVGLILLFALLLALPLNLLRRRFYKSV